MIKAGFCEIDERKMNLYILTEERPKTNTLKFIIKRFLCDKKFPAFIDNIRILPIVENERFLFCYEIIGVRCNQIHKIYLKIVSGSSSFVDYLVFFQSNAPSSKDSPLYVIEETKIDDKESRNTDVLQRISTFVYVDYFYPNVTKIMLYNLAISQKEKPTNTAIFGTRILRTLGVELAGKKFENELLQPFKSVDELIKFKNAMRKPPKNNVPINIFKSQNTLQISGRLVKNNSLSHDPNIGAISGIAKALRVLGFSGKIEIILHGLSSQKQVGKDNKFIQIANIIDISLQGLKVPKALPQREYWHYETKGEKLATIFIHLLVTHFTSGKAIFENHAGCEKGYFFDSDGKAIALEKYEDKKAYKEGDKNKRLFIPDLILLDSERLEILNIEGKKFENKNKGIDELKNYDFIEKAYIKKFYPKYKIIRTLVLFGGVSEKIIEVEIGFLLNKQGKMILGIKAPQIFRIALKNLFDFWSVK